MRLWHEETHVEVKTYNQRTSAPENFFKLKCSKSARRCGRNMPETHLEVNMYKKQHVRTTFGTWDVEKVHAIVSRSIFGSQKTHHVCTNFKRSSSSVIFRGRRDYNYQLELQLHYKILIYYNTLHLQLHYTKPHYTTPTTIPRNCITQLRHTTTPHNYATQLHHTTTTTTTLQLQRQLQVKLQLQHYKHTTTTATPRYTTLHYSTLHYTTQRYTAALSLTYATLCHATLPYTARHYTTVQYTTLQQQPLHLHLQLRLPGLPLHHTTPDYNYSTLLQLQ